MIVELLSTVAGLLVTLLKMLPSPPPPTPRAFTIADADDCETEM
jgi:hypothetical protein